ncbi:MAG TPA: trypsin-like peptidase domain-containing protein [Thermoanaerobaculia bacterium]|nr:trypsin-like peptidase domain-containing protein [Thermoanaerobaculia bacterium]
MRRKLAWLMLLAFGSVAAHAAPEAVVPTAAEHAMLDVSRVDSFVPSQLDLARLGEEDVARDREGLPPRFAVPEKVSIRPETHGTWETLKDGRMLWRLRIVGREGTNSLNLGFTTFKMPKRGRLLLYSADRTQVSRPFTHADNEAHGELWTPVITARDLIVELTVPRNLVRQVKLELGWINQGYRGFGTIAGDDYNKSGSCNLDVECLGSTDTWRQEMRSVGVISTGGSTFCTGSLINNTAGDRKMYFITANHCGITSSNASSLVVYWNYQNSFCRAPGSAASGQVGDGQLNQFHTGSFFRASYSASDVTLVELDDPAVTAYNHHWAGWDRSTGSHTCNGTTPCASIHHPSTDEKRITYVTTDMVSTSYNSPTSPGDGTHLWARWATDPPGPYTVPGVTEPGSSGSPLYNNAGRFVGQLHGGPSSCGATGNNLSDYYGRFSVSWTGGGTNSTRLSNWLDAGNTGATTTNGIDVNTGPCTPPAVPTGLSATAISPTQINLSWTGVSGATSYPVQRSTTNGGPYASAGSAATTSFASTGLACNTTYYFVVNSSNGSCSSANSAQAQATTQACPVCTNVNDTEPNNTRTAPQAISGACNQISGTFLNDSSTGQEDFFRLSVPAGRTVTGLLNGLSVDYDLYLYTSTTGSAVASSLNAGTTADQASWTNTGGSAVNVYVRVYRYSSTRTTYQLKVSY